MQEYKRIGSYAYGILIGIVHMISASSFTYNSIVMINTFCEKKPLIIDISLLNHNLKNPIIILLF